MTSGVGTFSFSLPAKVGFTNTYDDIGNNYKVKIYFGYNGVYTHLFSGKILPLTSNISKDRLVRFFEGKSLSEILERRFKYNKRWQAVDADVIVAELCDASNLNLASNITADASHETITVRTESYFDVLKKVSDYWVNAGSRVNRDIWVDKDNVLQWVPRPARTVGVESFTYGNDFIDYNLKYDILGVKNKITVYGAAAAPYPLDKDALSDSLTDWTAINGALALTNAAPYGAKAGTYRISVSGNNAVGMYRTLPKRIHLRDINKLSLWYVHAAFQPKVILYAPDSSNTFAASLPGATGAWRFFEGGLGEVNEYDVDERPSGIWTKTGSPNWWDIEATEFSSTFSAGAWNLDVDKIWFSPERWTHTPSEYATSQNVYGLREAEFTDDNLLSEAECQVRAETLLYQLKDRVLRLDFTVPGNTNVLLGDQLSITLPLDNISNVAFDVVSVEHHFGMQGYQTTVHLMQGANTRQLPPMTTLDSIQQQFSQNKAFMAELYTRIVR